MTIDERSVLPLWLDLLSADTEAHRAIDGHPLRLYYGVDAMSRPVFFLITPQKPETPLFSNLIQVVRRERKEQNEWSLVLTLQDPHYVDAFIALCLELSRLSGEADSEERAVSRFYKALNQWRQIFARNSAKPLSLEEQRGLIAELWLARHFATSLANVETALQSWTGPMGAVHDFLLPEGTLVEVKATHMESRGVSISSLEQLDPRSAADLKLVVIAIEPTQPDADQSYSIASLINQLFEMAFSSELATAALEDRLAKLRISDSFLTLDNAFYITGVSTYRVSEGFPRIKRDAAPLGVDRVTYRLQLNGIEDFRDDQFGIDRT